jgi:hypothetical protein
MSSAMETIGSIAQIIGGVLGGGGSSVLPGGALALGNYESLPSADVSGGYVGQYSGGGLSAMFVPYRATPAGHSAQRFIGINPTSGRMQWFGPLGHPVLWSGDLTACRRVRKVAGKARRRLGGR